MIEAIKNLLDLFHSKNISYCHWKSSQHLDATVSGKTDLDILVDKNEFNAIKNDLPSIGFKQFKVSDHRSYPFLFDYLAYDVNSNSIVHLHLHTRLNIGPKHHKFYLLAVENEILSNRVMDETFGIYRIRYDYELLVLLIRQSVKIRKRDYLIKLITFRNFFKSYKRELDWLSERVTEDEYNRAFQELFRIDPCVDFKSTKKEKIYSLRTFRKLFKESVKTGKLVSIESNLTANIKRWKREVYRIFYEIFMRAGLKFISNRRKSFNDGFICAFVGGDGSGKSSVSKVVNSKFVSQMDTAYIYLGTGDGNNSILLSIFKPIHKLFHKIGLISVRGKIESLKNFNEQTKENSLRSFLHTPWALILMYDRYRKLQKIKKYLSQGYLIITDRYPQKEVKNVFDGPRLTGKFSRLENRIINQYLSLGPDLILRFECSPETSVSRKSKEVIIEQAEFNLKTLRSIGEYNKPNSLLVDADNDFEEVTRFCVNNIFKRL